MQKKATGKLIGYARVSTEEQNLQVQLDELQKAGCWNIWKEKRSATRGPRPELDKALTDLRAGDTLVVWKLDRLIRHARDLYRILDLVEASGATVKSLSEPHLDIHSPIGEFMMGMTAHLAQLEVRTTSARTSRGIQAMRERGQTPGAKPMLSPAKAAKLLKLRKSGLSKAELGRRFGVSAATVTNYINRAKRKRART